MGDPIIAAGCSDVKIAVTSHFLSPRPATRKLDYEINITWNNPVLNSILTGLSINSFIPWVAAQAVRLSGIPNVARSRLSQCSKSCDLQPSPHCSVQYVELGVLPCVGWGCDQSFGSTVFDAIVRSWLWLTATRSSPLGYFSKLLQVVDNWIHILW